MSLVLVSIATVPDVIYVATKGQLDINWAIIIGENTSPSHTPLLGILGAAVVVVTDGHADVVLKLTLPFTKHGLR